MNGEDLAERVRRHYQTTESPLLLADLGVELRNARIWPVDGDKRPLAHALAEIAPALTVLSDPGSKAFVVVTLKGEEDKAHRAFARRRRERLLRRLPRAMILAFCATLEEGSAVYLCKTPPYRYSSGPDPGAGWWPVEPEFRAPGLFIDFNRSVGAGNADRLMQGIEAWAERHGADLDALAAAEVRSPTRPPVPNADFPVPTVANALERLCNAQPPELAKRLVVPMDIALLLSRSP
jgi:hypothetical protein